MKRTILIGCLSVLMAAPALGQRLVRDSVKLGGQWRRYWMQLPAQMKQGAPLVMVCHGYGNIGKSDSWMKQAAEKNGFALCIPQGLKDPKGKHSWNVGYPFQQGWKQNDVKDLCRIARHVQKKYGLSRENCFLTGMSNGGEMCYLMAYSKQDVFKAFAAVSGLCMEWIYSSMDAPCPRPFFEIHGTKDHTSEWAGDLQNKGGWGAYMPVPVAIGYWVAQNRCTHEVTDTVPGLRNNGMYTIRHHFAGGKEDVWLYEVVGSGHSWHDKEIDTGGEIWNFFRKYVK
ncbi:MAG: prolyl oligopeptidase family serine peptidase [Bacteroidaceae bacterium]|nr:prolyl oligopeptidase family serine peptidase [Bacteroidaceae bacterium]